MQWPPTPGPGVKRMKPNGLVAAASMTSQTSRPIRSHSRASWLTSAMLTFRKTFSRSLASSAASGDESSTTWSLMRRSSAAARAVLCGVVPPTSRGIVLDALAGSPGLTRSGAKARSKSGPASSPVVSSTSRNAPDGRPREGRRLEDHELAGMQVRRDRLGRADDRAEVGVLGRGHRRRHADEDRVGGIEAGLVGTTDVSPSAIAAASRSSEMSSIGEWPRRRSSILAGFASTPVTREAGLRERDREGQADVAEADDGDVAVGGVGHRSVSTVRRGFRASDIAVILPQHLRTRPADRRASAGTPVRGGRRPDRPAPR